MSHKLSRVRPKPERGLLLTSKGSFMKTTFKLAAAGLVAAVFAQVPRSPRT